MLKREFSKRSSGLQLMPEQEAEAQRLTETRGLVADHASAGFQARPRVVRQERDRAMQNEEMDCNQVCSDHGPLRNRM
jgi:hypothetical protein